MFSFKYCPVAVLVLLLAACGAAPPRQAAGPREAPAQAPQPPRGGALYRIDPAQSELRLLVYRSGTMARLGHNHVIVNRSLDGWVAVAASIAASSFWLKIPAAAFAVDEAGARAEEGADFAAVVAEDAKSATLRNMLGAALLDADRFPDITVRSLELHESVDGSASGTPVALLRIRVAGRDSTLSVPFSLERTAGRLSATGETGLRQSAIGLRPFSVMHGAIQVQDELRLKFRIVAFPFQAAGKYFCAGK